MRTYDDVGESWQLESSDSKKIFTDFSKMEDINWILRYWDSKK